MPEAVLNDPPRLRGAALAVALWGVLGVVVLLSQALYRLTPLAIEPLEQHALNAWQQGLYWGWVLLSAYAEGYRGFQKGFVPRVVARAVYLGHHRRALHVAVAPLFCMALLHAQRRQRIVSWSLLLGIIALVVLVRQLDQPWRGIVDGGVVVGLAWGLLCLLVQFGAALVRGAAPGDPKLPTAVGAATP